MVALGLSAQTTVYLRSSGPASVQITSVMAGTPAIVNTSSAHGFSAGQVVTVQGACSGTSDGTVAGQSAVNGKVKVVSPFTTNSFGVGNYLTGAPITGTASSTCIAGAAWVGLLTPYTLGTGPLGWLGGINGTQYRELALNTSDGNLTSLAVSSNVATVTVPFNHATFGISNGAYVGMWNSGTAALDKNGGNGCGTPPCSGEVDRGRRGRETQHRWVLRASPTAVIEQLVHAHLQTTLWSMRTPLGDGRGQSTTSLCRATYSLSAAHQCLQPHPPAPTAAPGVWPFSSAKTSALDSSLPSSPPQNARLVSGPTYL